MTRTAAFLVTVVLAVGAADGFNLEPRLPIIKQGERGSYFGYSVAEHLVLDENANRVLERFLLVGAPRAQTSQPGTNRSGAIYRCGLTTYLKDCDQLLIDQEKQAPEDDVIKDDQWLGVTLKSQGPGGYVVTCAHRYIQKGRDYQWGQGICYSLTQDLDLNRVWDPCENMPKSRAHEQFGFCQAGTSGDISEDLDIVIGSPGPYTWRGTVFANSIRLGFKDNKKWYMGAVTDKEAPVDKYSYLGMSVASGRFFGTNSSFAAGAPRSNGTGQVIFFTRPTSTSQTLLVQSILDGEQFASSFGYSLASLDINNDGLADLVVGAPFYFTRNEGGAVYVYMSTPEDGIREKTVPLKLTGKPESRFGFALASAGDLNNDGYRDLAIGAPYEGSGAVYIYLGSAEGLIKEPAQIILVSDIPKIESRARRRVTTFGYSLAGGVDIDGNDYPDLLVGCYESDTAILFRSRPIIDIVTTVKGNLTNIDPNSQGCEDDRAATSVCFSFEACFRFNSSVVRQRPTINLKYRIEAETFTGKKYYRVKFKSTMDTDEPNIVEKELVLRGSSLVDSHCSKELVYLKDKSDIQNAIKFKLTYSLIQKEPKQPAEGERLPDINNFPILNQQEASRIFEAKFLKDCGENEICESNLHLEADLNLPKEPDSDALVLYLGEEHVNMSIKVVNTKEPAYDATVYINHPISLSYIARKVVKGPQVICTTHNATVLKCDLGNPFAAGESEIQIRFSPSRVKDDETTLKFKVHVNTTSYEEKPQKEKLLVADIVRMAELELRGGSKPEQVFYGGKLVGESVMVYEDDVGSPVIHTYELWNHGPWKVKRVDVIVSWPYEVENKEANGKWLLYMIEEPQLKGNGYCDIKREQFNPLGLVENPKLKLPIKRENNNYSEEGEIRESPKRSKREVVILPEELRMEGKTVKVVTMDCERGSAKCFQFRCTILNLLPDNTSMITIRARLWNSTFVEDYPHVSWVSIISRAEIHLDPILDIKQRKDNDYAKAETKAQPDGLYQKAEDVPLWIIIVAVIGGLLLLVILIIILWRLGFFKRKKPGYELANSHDEKEPNNY